MTLEIDSTAGQSDPPLKDVLRSSTCPACGYHVAVPFYDGGCQPLATVAWPGSADEAHSMPRYRLYFVRCVDCGHVYNSEFDYSVVPYSDKPNLMYNRGEVWAAHLEHVRDLIVDWLPRNPVVVEIGCGDGRFLRSLAKARPTGRFIGFDPHGAFTGDGNRLESRQCLFDPAEHLAEYRPDLIISRHVFEHLINPLGFVQALSFAANWEAVDTNLFIEVPCIDKALALGRTVDFFYEHNSNFSSVSLKRLLERCATKVEVVERGYRDEVVYGLARFTKEDEQVALAEQALAFRSRVADLSAKVRQALHSLTESRQTVAIWGGTGKAAAFINQYGLDPDRFPIVVDSDLEKVGTFVPGSGQEIRSRDYLLSNPVDVILIATQWRAPDIAAEIKSCGIPFERLMIEYDGQLVDYFDGQHPYRPD